MNKLRSALKSYFLLIFILWLVACNPSATAPATPTKVDENAMLTEVFMKVAAQLTQTAAAQPTVTASPTAPSIEPTEPITLAPTWTPISTSMPLQPFTLNGLRAAYILDGNLYIQDSGGEPVQLTESGKDSFPQFSDDGQRLIVYRDADIFLINPANGEEQKLALAKFLDPLNLGYDKFTTFGTPVFVPHTHQLIFQTNGNDDLALLDVDSRKVSQLLPIGSQARYFQPSPNGKLAWVRLTDHLEVVNLRSKSRQRVTDYPSLNTPYVPGGKLPEIYWSQDSSKLSFILPLVKTLDDSIGPEPRTIWQYSVNNNEMTKTLFSPPPLEFSYSISPNGNNIVYFFFKYCCYPFKMDITPAPDGIYLGNLLNNTTQKIHGAVANNDLNNYQWNPDSTVFVFYDDSQQELVIENINGAMTQLPSRRFLSWIDNNRYVYLDGDLIMGDIGNPDVMQVVDLPRDFYQQEEYVAPDDFTFVFISSK